MLCEAWAETKRHVVFTDALFWVWVKRLKAYRYAFPDQKHYEFFANWYEEMEWLYGND